MFRRGIILASVCGLILDVSLLPQSRGNKPIYIPYADARPILEALAEVLPAELKGVPPSSLLAVWPDWVARRDGEIRARLAQGEEDSLVNLLLFGTSFTRQPRVTQKELERFAPQPLSASSVRPRSPQAEGAADPGAQAGRLIESRLDDLVRALAAPGENGRLAFAQRVLQQKGYTLGTAAGRAQAKAFFVASVLRVMKEQEKYAQALEAARQLGDATEEFAERSKLYRHRGLSLDTSLLPNFAIEQSLQALEARGLLAARSVRHVAIVGPGLDFVDKQGGYDFYPEQTIQPFALIDTLLRLGLAGPDALEVTTLDISPRVNAHLARARQRAARGIGYALQLPHDPAWQWKPETVRYWERFGGQVGVPARPAALPAGLGPLKIRAVRIRPTVVARVTPVDLNIVLQQLARQDGPTTAGRPAAEAGFDLIVATNVFVYYDVFEQSLALANVKRMLRLGGFLLSNNALLELPGSGVRSAGYLTTVYSDRPDDGDHIVWYQRVTGEAVP